MSSTGELGIVACVGRLKQGRTASHDRADERRSIPDKHTIPQHEQKEVRRRGEEEVKKEKLKVRISTKTSSHRRAWSSFVGRARLATPHRHLSPSLRGRVCARLLHQPYQNLTIHTVVPHQCRPSSNFIPYTNRVNSGPKFPNHRLLTMPSTVLIVSSPHLASCIASTHSTP
ncbi:hypothetical protein GQ43DRAFT_242989 [Delitschia confertaspora ATCC 74209]|uniref:Uncharacterized protein n=1 Tax=Delitschia confertaspora ATCC 74209 TaxID=1513339 RepID=A0A9P4JHN6_9PLEO|nr:hypothetical protein GQ43DRAFT_242989 [Delitschia confertaspora ATCC 74209]